MHVTFPIHELKLVSANLFSPILTTVCNCKQNGNVKLCVWIPLYRYIVGLPLAVICHCWTWPGNTNDFLGMTINTEFHCKASLNKNKKWKDYYAHTKVLQLAIELLLWLVLLGQMAMGFIYCTVANGGVLREWVENLKQGKYLLLHSCMFSHA